MKKTVSFLLALLLICCMAVPACAEDYETTITLDIDDTLESYEVTIPPTITLDAKTFATEGGGRTGLNITIDSVTAVWSNSLYVYVTSKNGFYLVNESDPSKMIAYAITCPTGLGQVGRDSNTEAKKVHYAWLRMSDLQGKMPYTTVNGYIMRAGNDAYPGGGTYTDTLTFTFKFTQE